MRVIKDLVFRVIQKRRRLPVGVSTSADECIEDPSVRVSCLGLGFEDQGTRTRGLRV